MDRYSRSLFNQVCTESVCVLISLLICALISVGPTRAGNPQATSSSYSVLVDLLRDVRALERPTTPDGVPDYRESTLQRVRSELMQCHNRLMAIDTSGWSLEHKIDCELVRAEMNGFDFDLRVLQPWARDPAYYAVIWTEQSDTPSHEGPVCHAAIELWTYEFPLSTEAASKLASQLAVIPPLLRQARINLTGNARDLWIAGIRSLRGQVTDLEDLAKRTAHEGTRLRKALDEATSATVDFAEWLEQQAPLKTGPSGVGKENYTWFLRHVLLVPLSWEEEVMLLKRELGRAYASLQLERQRNRHLPPIVPVSTPEEYARRADQSARRLMEFLRKNEILPVREYMEPELRKHLMSFQPEEQRNFFLKITHLDPTVLYTHSTHWFEIARQREEPHPDAIRRDPLPFNIWMSRSEGLATGVEEMFMHAGLYDDAPRSRELVWIMLAQRCARGLASLYVHANEMTLPEARAYQVTWTPPGWTGDVSLVGFEQHLYLRQPGYGTSYVTGKHLIDRLVMDRSRQLGDSFRVQRFFEELYSVGMIPVSLVRWQMTGLDEEISSITRTEGRR